MLSLVAAENNEAGLNVTEEWYSLSTPDAERCLKPSDLRKVPSCLRRDGGSLGPPRDKSGKVGGGSRLIFIVFLIIENIESDAPDRNVCMDRGT